MPVPNSGSVNFKITTRPGAEFGTGTGIKKIEYYIEGISNCTLDSRSEH